MTWSVIFLVKQVPFKISFYTFLSLPSYYESAYKSTHVFPIILKPWQNIYIVDRTPFAVAQYLCFIFLCCAFQNTFSWLMSPFLTCFPFLSLCTVFSLFLWTWLCFGSTITAYTNTCFWVHRRNVFTIFLLAFCRLLLKK